MIIPLKPKYTNHFDGPKRAGPTDNGTRRKMHRKKTANAPQVFRCPCGGEIKMVTRFRRSFKTLAVCQKCGKERRKPNEF